MENKTLEKSSKNVGFLSYLEDTGKTNSGYFDFLEINSSFVKIKTRENIIIIPMTRILKIKLKDGDTI